MSFRLFNASPHFLDSVFNVNRFLPREFSVLCLLCLLLAIWAKKEHEVLRSAYGLIVVNVTSYLGSRFRFTQNYGLTETERFILASNESLPTSFWV